MRSLLLTMILLVFSNSLWAAVPCEFTLVKSHNQETEFPLEHYQVNDGERTLDFIFHRPPDAHGNGGAFVNILRGGDKQGAVSFVEDIAKGANLSAQDRQLHEQQLRSYKMDHNYLQTFFRSKAGDLQWIGYEMAGEGTTSDQFTDGNRIFADIESFANLTYGGLLAAYGISDADLRDPKARQREKSLIDDFQLLTTGPMYMAIYRSRDKLYERDNPQRDDDQPNIKHVATEDPALYNESVDAIKKFNDFIREVAEFCVVAKEASLSPEDRAKYQQACDLGTKLIPQRQQEQFKAIERNLALRAKAVAQNIARIPGNGLVIRALGGAQELREEFTRLCKEGLSAGGKPQPKGRAGDATSVEF